MQRSRARAVKSPSTRAALIRIGALALVLAVASLIGYNLGWFDYRHTFEHVTRLREGHSLVGFIVVFVLTFAVGTSLGVPGLPFTIAAGALFGTVLGSALSWCGALIGAAAGYWIARTVGHRVVTQWLKRFRRADAAVAEARDFSGMLRLRLIPVFPLGIVNFIGGLARAPFGSYLAASAIGVLPATVIYAYFADSLLEGVGNGRHDALKSLVVATGLLVVISLAPKWINRHRVDDHAAAD
ncbi:MAG: TVP38/TMEM64 family protein [bacterium]